jgi:hypothetical protein
VKPIVCRFIRWYAHFILTCSSHLLSHQAISTAMSSYQNVP